MNIIDASLGFKESVIQVENSIVEQTLDQYAYKQDYEEILQIDDTPVVVQE